MDRSFLSRPGVVAASRRFVCIRPLTYESAEEAKVLESLFIGGSGELENTTFALLGPDGRTRLARTGRSPAFAFRDPEQMAAAMQDLAARHETGASKRPAALPVCADVRRALDVAACDGRALV